MASSAVGTVLSRMVVRSVVVASSCGPVAGITWMIAVVPSGETAGVPGITGEA